MTFGEGDRRARHQWILLPPMLENMAPPGAPILSNPSFFHRKQETPDNKTVWAAHMLNAPHKYTALHLEIAELERIGWAPKPIITCEVHPEEMRDIAAEWKTPWKVLNRLIRVADRKHGFKI
jgi:hypothetical protein